MSTHRAGRQGAEGCVLALRCELALRELESGQKSMDAVAQDLGFSDTSAFYKAFRRWMGRSPSDFAPT